MSSSVQLGQLTAWSAWGDYNSLIFAIRNAIGKLNTATLVKVQACSNDGGLSPVGTVDVLPLVNQLDGSNPPKAIPHITVFGLPYLRIQGGANGLIMDPHVGDVGVIVTASRDISSVKATGGTQSNPGSGRRFSLSDGIYLGTVISATAPTQYVQFNSDGIAAVSPTAVKVTAPSIQLGASGGTPQTLMTHGFYEWYVTNIEPFLIGFGYSGPAPPANSVTTVVEAQ